MDGQHTDGPPNGRPVNTSLTPPTVDRKQQKHKSSQHNTISFVVQVYIENVSETQSSAYSHCSVTHGCSALLRFMVIGKQ